jgi:hypothetical protein
VLAVGGRDVILDEDWNAGERVAFRRLLPVAQFGDGERVRVDLVARGGRENSVGSPAQAEICRMQTDSFECV